MLELKIPLGRYDDPEKQTQKDFGVDLLKSNIAVFGSSMSGKTTLLKTLLLRLHQELALTDKEEIYILDFGNSLKPYGELPYTVGYFNASHEENVRRVFRILDEKLAENMRALSGEIYAEAPDEKCPSHVTFILDGFSSFAAEDRYAVYHDSLKKLAREGLSKGITVVLTAAEAGGFSRMLPSFATTIAFDLPKDQYSALFTGKVEKPMVLPGRGVANIETQSYEFQAYLPWNTFDPEMSEKRMIQQVDRWITFYGLDYDRALLGQEQSKEELVNQILTSPENKARQRKNLDIHKAYLNRKLKILPEKLTAENWGDCCKIPYHSDDGNFVAGLDYHTLKPVPAALNLREAQTIAIYGRKEFGKSNLLKLLLEAADRLPDTHFCFWDDGRQALSKPAGLWDTISRLKQKEFVRSREEFLTSLQRYGFLKTPEGSSRPAVTPRDYTGFDDSYGDDDVCVQKRRAFRKAQEAWEQQWDLEFQEKRQRMIDEGTWDREMNRLERENHDRERAQREIDFEQDLEQRKQERRSQRNTHYTASITHTSAPAGNLTVFVVQSRLFYQNPPGGERYHMIPHIVSAMGTTQDPVLFIFSDVQRIESNEVQTYFNNSIRYAFLLDDIVRYINNKGQRSVFGNQDIGDLKERFGPCELGDGFFYDIDRDEISKLKFLSSHPEKERGNHV